MSRSANQAFPTLAEVEELVAKKVLSVTQTAAVDSRVNFLPLVARGRGCSLVMGI